MLTRLAAALMIGIMAGYHAYGVYRSRRIKDVSVIADGCYYLGFIFTLGMLFISIVLGDHNIDKVINQFGLGLLTTGYGLIARIHLSGMKEEVEESLEDSLARQEQLSAKIHGISVALENGAIATNELFRKQSESLVENMSSTRENLSREVTSFAALANDFSLRLGNLSTTFIPDKEASALKNAIGSFAQSMVAGRVEADKVASTFQDVSQSMSKLLQLTDANMSSVSHSATAMGAKVNVVNEALDLLRDALASLEQGAQASGAEIKNTNLRTAQASIEEFALAVKESSLNVSEMRESFRRTVASARALEAAQNTAAAAIVIQNKAN
ncbi:MAG: hypothetical protein EOP05_01195 [Proteobacteria bacterium]|nr:MAG: hypothetical protein EOP05_01195 [Pseudomonadota bacterium]